MIGRVAAIVAAAAAVAVALGGARADQVASTAGPAEKFDHASHARRTPAVDIARCEACHQSGEAGALIAPGKLGHQPCLSSGCHVDDFLAVGPKTAKADPARYARAAGFCRGCHDGPRDVAPRRSERPAADAVWKHNPSPDHHVELDHLEHAGKTACRACHVVAPTSFALLQSAPGHAQCAACHGKSDDAHPMGACGKCHAEPAAAAYFTGPRHASDVRSCGTEAHAALVAERKEAVPCFKHERTEHRFQGSEELQCSTCHFMIDDKARWGAFKYQSVKDIKASPIIHNQRDLAHKSCGASGCHAPDVDDSRGSANCRLCHSKKVVDQGLFE